MDELVVTFIEEDIRRLHHPHNDAIVITLTIANFTTRSVQMDNGISVDILYYLTFQYIRIDRELLCSANFPLIGFGGTKVLPVGIVSLHVMVGAYPQHITKEANFLIVDCSSSAIIGKLTLNRLESCNVHLLLVHQVPNKVWHKRSARRLVDNQRSARTIFQPIEVLEDVPLDKCNPDKFTRIRTKLEEKKKQDFVLLLKKSKDVFGLQASYIFS